MKLRIAGALLCAFAPLAATWAQEPAAPPFPPGTTGTWQIYCTKDGKVVGVQIIVLVPGEFQLKLSPEPCKPSAGRPGGNPPAQPITPLPTGKPA